MRYKNVGKNVKFLTGVIETAKMTVWHCVWNCQKLSSVSIVWHFDKSNKLTKVDISVKFLSNGKKEIFVNNCYRKVRILTVVIELSDFLQYHGSVRWLSVVSTHKKAKMADFWVFIKLSKVVISVKFLTTGNNEIYWQLSDFLQFYDIVR